MKRCEFCGSNINDNETSCPNCGGYLGVSKTEEKDEIKTEENISKSTKAVGKTIFIIAAVMIIAVLFLFIIMAVNIFKHGNATFEKVQEVFNNKASFSYFIK